MEVWKTLIYQNEKYPQFSISNHGNLKNEKTGTIYKKTRIKSGYFTVCVSLGNKKKKNIKIHRAVAETFIPNPKKLPQVNHIDGIKTNNIVENLEWVSISDNAIHSSRVLRNNVRKINQYDLKGRYLATYSSITIAGEINNIRESSIANVLAGRRNKTFGYKWKYADED